MNLELGITTLPLSLPFCVCVRVDGMRKRFYFLTLLSVVDVSLCVYFFICIDTYFDIYIPLNFVAILCLFAGWRPVFSRSNTTGDSGCRTHAKLNSCDSAACPCLPTTSWGPHIPLSSKLPPIWSLFFPLLCPTTSHPPIFGQQCVSSATSGWQCISSSTGHSCHWGQILTSAIQTRD